MAEFKSYSPGMFCWTDYTSADIGASLEFYGSLFGWRGVEQPSEDGMPRYLFFTLEEKVVCGIGELPSSMKEQGVPPMWNSYISTNDVDASCTKAKELGGSVMMPPFDISDKGRMAMVVSPEGAYFGLWQAKNHIGADIANIPGSVTWNELATNDVAKSIAFYEELCAWKSVTEQMGETSYTSFTTKEGRPAGGMLEMTDSPQWEGVPPHWSVYFAVGDCDEAVKRAKELGGSVLVPPTDIPDMGRFAVLKDNIGGVFSVMYLQNPDS